MKKKIVIPICIVIVAVAAFVGYMIFSSQNRTLTEEYNKQIAYAKTLSMDDMLSQCIYENYSTIQSSPDDYLSNYVDVVLQITQDMGDGVYIGVEPDNSENLWAVYDYRETGASFVVGGTAEICGIFAGNIDVTLEDSRTLSTPAVIAIYSEMDRDVLTAMSQIAGLSDPAEASQISEILEMKSTVESLSDTQRSRVRNILKYNDIINSLDDIAETNPYKYSINAAMNQYNRLDNVDGFNLTRMIYATCVDNNGDPHYYVYMAFDYTDVYGTNTRKETIAMYDKDGNGNLLDRDEDILYGAAQSIIFEDDTERQEVNVDFVKYYLSKY